ncbi:ABC transporter substrate-binding protein [Pseudarthrobacter sp. NPDC057230]|uniref:ABC transporter substrate-binding protein n=1 Tax=Pseudarthrobacter sp. NPDC057230 TaxID=3346057 RepID=UPI0036459775
MQRRHRWMPKMLFGVLAIFMLAGCASSADGAGTGTSGSNNQVTIGVGADATYGLFFVADAQGLFKEAGLNVKIRKFAAGGDAIQAIAGKEVQLAGSSPTTLLTVAAENPDLRAPFVYMESGSYTKVVARPTIKAAADIKTFGVVPGLSTFLAHTYLKSEGIDPASVKFVSSDPATLPSLAQKGDVDAFVLWEPWPSRGVALGLTVLQDTGSFDQPIMQVLAGNQEWIDQNASQVATIAKVLQQASDFVQSDPEKASAAIAKATGGDQNQSAKDMALVNYGARAYEESDYSAIAQQAEFFVKAGTLKQAPALKTIFIPSWYSENVK